MSSLPGSCIEGGRKHGRTTMDRAAAGRIVRRGAELAQGGYRRGRFALRKKGRGCAVRWRFNERRPWSTQAPITSRYWQRAYSGIESADLKILDWSRDDDDRAPDGVVATGRQPPVHGLRRCRPCGAQRSLLWKVAMRFSDLSCSSTRSGSAPRSCSSASRKANTLKILVPREERGNPIAPTLSASVAFLGAIDLPIGLLSLYLLGRPHLFGARRAACVIPDLCRVSLQSVRQQPSGLVAWRKGRGGVLARVEGPDASAFCHRCDAIRSESCCRPPARVFSDPEQPLRCRLRCIAGDQPAFSTDRNIDARSCGGTACSGSALGGRPSSASTGCSV